MTSEMVFLMELQNDTFMPYKYAKDYDEDGTEPLTYARALAARGLVGEDVSSQNFFLTKKGSELLVANGLNIPHI